MCRLRVHAAIVHAAARDHRQPTADDGFLAIHRTLFLVPMSLPETAAAQVRSHLFHPPRIDAGGPARPQPCGFHQFHGHHPFVPLGNAEQAGAGKHREKAASRASIGLVFPVPQPELPRHASQQAAVDRDVGKLVAGKAAHLHAPFPFQQFPQFIRHICPLDHPAHVEKSAGAELPQRVAFPFAIALAERSGITPHAQDAREVAFSVLPSRMGSIRLAHFFRRALPWIVALQRCDDREHFRYAMFFLRFDEHAPEPRVHRQPRHTTSIVGQVPVTIERPHLAQRAVSLGHRLRRWRIEKGKLIDLGESERLHAQDHPGQ